MADRYLRAQILDRTSRMWDDELVYHYQDLRLASESEAHSVFLAGTSSGEYLYEYGWRPSAVFHLRKAGYKGVIYVPEPRNDDWSLLKKLEVETLDWEIRRLTDSSVKIIWIDRNEINPLRKVTNTKLSLQICRGYESKQVKERIMWGYSYKMKTKPPWVSLPGAKFFTDLESMCIHANKKIRCM